MMHRPTPTFATQRALGAFSLAGRGSAGRTTTEAVPRHEARGEQDAQRRFLELCEDYMDEVEAHYQALRDSLSDDDGPPLVARVTVPRSPPFAPAPRVRFRMAARRSTRQTFPYDVRRARLSSGSQH